MKLLAFVVAIGYGISVYGHHVNHDPSLWLDIANHVMHSLVSVVGVYYSVTVWEEL